MGELLKVDHVTKIFKDRKGRSVCAVNDLSLVMEEGESVSVVGESGCGKSTLARVITRIEKESAGQVFFEGANLSALKGKALQKKRQHMQMVFQQPLSAISPRMHIGTFLSIPLRNFGIKAPAEIPAEVDRLLEMVRLPAAYKDKYPHEVSGGELQRIMVARAMAARPRLIICDEATSALDVSVQQDVIQLLKDLNEKQGVAYLFITHNLSLVHEISSRLIVMYHGRIMESMGSEQIRKHALHPYTKFLLSAVFTVKKKQAQPIEILEDAVGPVTEGCPFSPRCPNATQRCRSELPSLRQLGDDGHFVACHAVNTEKAELEAV